MYQNNESSGWHWIPMVQIDVVARRIPYRLSEAIQIDR